MCECMLLSPKGTLDTAWVGHLCFFFCFWLLAEVRAREILRKECVCEREGERERERACLRSPSNVNQGD